jgi:hypothetical protein
MGFCSLQHILATRVHCSRGCRPRYVPPSGFGYPLDGLLPSKPHRACFVPAALLGLPLRRTLRKVANVFRRRPDLHAVSPVLSPAATKDQRAGALDTDFQALTLPRVPGIPKRFRQRTTWTLPWGFPFQGIPPNALSGFHTALPLRALRIAAAPTAATPRLRVSIGTRLTCTHRNQRANNGENKQPS